MKMWLAGLLLVLMNTNLLGQNDDALKLNQIQIIGSHNSYKKLPDPRVMKFLMKLRKRLGKKLDPIGLDYGHLPFDSQFTDYGMRGLEIDIYYDPQGGVYYKRRINAYVHGLHQKSGVDALLKPGFKVLHIKDVDYQTNYYTFVDALAAVKKWSDAHPKHLPLFINIETKTAGPGDASKLLRVMGFKRTVPYDSVACDAMDAEIKSVFGADLKNILTPDKLKGKYASLNEMVKQDGWPLLNDCRGKIIFIMLGDAKNLYLEGHPSLTGRAMCIYGHPGNAECAFVMQDDPVRDSAGIAQLVRQGYIVRTRSDAETTAARDNDTIPREMALRSGAHIISTDYYKPDTRFSNFTVRWEDGHPGRVNPVTGKAKALEWLKE